MSDAPIPDGFELVDTQPVPDGFEAVDAPIPDGFEAVDTPSMSWPVEAPVSESSWFEPFAAKEVEDPEAEALRAAFKVALISPADTKALNVARALNVPVGNVTGRLDGVGNLDALEMAAKAAEFDPVRFKKENPLLTRVLLDNPHLGKAVTTSKPLSIAAKAINAVTDLWDDNAYQQRVMREDIAKRDGPQTGLLATLGQTAAMSGPVPIQVGDSATPDPAARAERDRPKPVTEYEDEQSQAYRNSFFSGLKIPVARGIEQFQAMEIARLKTRRMKLELAGEDTAAIDAEIHDATLAASPRAYGEKGLTYNLGVAAGGAASTLAILPDALEKGGIGAAAGALAGGLIGLRSSGPAGMAAGAAIGAEKGAEIGAMIGSWTGAFDLEAGSKYEALRAMKTEDGNRLSVEQAAGAAAIDAAFSATVETLTLKQTLGNYGPLKNLFTVSIRDQVAERMAASAGMRLALGGVGKQLAKSSMAEGVEEVVQQGGEDFTRWASASLLDGRQQSHAIFQADYPEAFTSGFLGGLLLGLPGASLTIGAKAIEVRRATIGARQAPAILDLAQDEMAQAGAQHFAKAIQEETAAQGEEVTALYVDPYAITQYFQGTKTNPDEAAAQLKEILGDDAPEKLAEAQATGEKLEIPLETVLRSFGASELGKALRDDTTTRRDAPTPRQLADGEMEKMLAEAEQIVAEASDKLETGAEVSGLVEDIKKQMRGAGRTRREADVAAVLFKAFYQTRASEKGVSVQEMFNQYRVAIGLAQTEDSAQFLTDRLLGNLPGQSGPLDLSTMARERFVDPVTNLRNRRGWDFSQRKPGTRVIAVSTGDTKAINDAEKGGHDTSNEMFALMGRAIGSIDNEAMRDGTKFYLHGNEAELQTVLAAVRAVLPAGINVDAAIGDTAEQAGTLVGDLIDAKQLDGTYKPRGVSDFKVETLSAETFRQPTETPAFEPNLSDAMLEQVSNLSPAQQFDDVYLDTLIPGLLSKVGFDAAPARNWVASIDLKGLAKVNTRLSKAMGNQLMAAFGNAAKMVGGSAVDLAHLSGDEFAAKHDSREELEAFLQDLEAELSRVVVEVYAGDTLAGSLTPLFRAGIGERTYGNADRVLNAAKRAETQAPDDGGVRGIAGFRDSRETADVRSEISRSGDRQLGRREGFRRRAAAPSFRGQQEVDTSFDFGQDAAPVIEPFTPEQMAIAEAYVGRLLSKKRKKYGQELLAFMKGEGPKPSSDGFEEMAIRIANMGVVHPDLSYNLATDRFEFAQVQTKSLKQQMKKGSISTGEGRAKMANLRRGVISPTRYDQGPVDIGSENFKKWFGDSKIVDAEGKPLVVFHGAPDVRGIFSEGFKARSRGEVFFAAEGKVVADSYADPRRAFDYQNAEPGTIPLYLNISNPMVVDADGQNWRNTEKFVQEAKDAGHDGIIIKNSVDFYNNPKKGGKTTTVYAWFRPTQAKSALQEQMRSRVDGQPIANALPNNGNFDPTKPQIYEQGPTGIQLNYESGQTSTPEFKAWFKDSKVVDENGRPKVVYHGSKRVDRIGKQFRKSRATSGPMVFFTDNPEIASSYAELKNDTSLGSPDTFAPWFKIRSGKGFVDLQRAWAALDQGERSSVSTALSQVGMTEDGNFSTEAAALVGAETWKRMLKTNNSNAFLTAVDVWLQSGTLFGDEERFTEVLAAAGIDSEFDGPSRSQAGVYPVLLSIQKPLVTTAVPPSVISALEKAARKAPAPSDTPDAGKKSMEPSDWIEILKAEQGENSFIWTAIPDWVTKELKKLGYDGVHDLGNKSGFGVDHDVWIPFEENQVKSAIGNRGTFDPTSKNILFQDPKDEARGFSEIPGLQEQERAYRIFLNPTADQSTIVHEAAHVFLDVLAHAATQPDASPRTKEIFDGFLKWVGAESREAITREQHEKFARGFEAFLFEGKAPSRELETVFGRFRRWLVNIYRSIMGLNVEMNDDVRKLYSRLLATEEEINQHLGKSGALEEGPLTETDQDEVDFATRKAALAAARTQLKETEGFWREELSKQKALANTAYELLPARIAERALSKMDLDRAAVERTLGKAAAKKFRTITDEGVLPDEAAVLNGYATGEEMLKAVLALPEKKQWVADKAEAETRAIHSDVAKEKAELTKLVQDGLHSYTEGKLLTAWPALSRELPAMKRAAQMMVEKRGIKSLRANDALIQERKAAREKAVAGVKGETAKALSAARRQMLNAQLYRELLNAEDEKEKFLELADELASKASRQRFGRSAPEFRDASDHILASLGLTNLEPSDYAAVVSAIAAMEADAVSVGEWRDSLATLLDKGSWEALTVSEMRVVNDALLNIRAASRNRANLKLGKRSIDKAEVVDQLLSSISPRLTIKPPRSEKSAMGTLQRIKDTAEEIDAFLLNPVDLVRDLSGDDLNSPWHEFIIDPMREAKQRETGLLSAVIEPITKAMEKMPKSVRASLSDKIDGAALFPDHIRDLVPTRRYQILMMALNAGNAGNLQRLLDGRNITPEQLKAALDLLTAEEIQWVQTVFDAAESLKAEAFAVEERDSGLRPKAVEATPQMLKNGLLRGGYFPAVYDKSASQIGERQAAQSLSQLMDPSYTRGSTPHSHTKSRSEAVLGAAISLEPSIIYRHLAQVTHDIAFRETVKSVGSLILDDRIDKALKSYLGTWKADQFIKWLKDVGAMRLAENNVASLMTWTRSNLAVSALGWSLPTAIGDIANVPAAVFSTQLKASSVFNGLRLFLDPTKNSYAAALELSGEMRFMRDTTRKNFDKHLKAFTESQSVVWAPFRWIKEHAFDFMEAINKATATPIWWGAYEQAKAEFAGDSTTPEAQAYAVKFADDVLTRVFPSHSAVDQSAILRDKGFWGMTTMFYGYMSTMYRAQHNITNRPDPKLTKAFNLLGFYIAAGVFGELLMGRGPEAGDGDDEETRRAAWLLRKLVAAPLSTVPLPFASVFESWVLNKRTTHRTSPVFAAIDTAARYGPVLFQEKEAAEKVEAAYRLAGPAFGWPQRPVQTVKYLGLGKPVDPFDAASGLIYGQRDGQAANPLSTISDAIGGPKN